MMNGGRREELKDGQRAHCGGSPRQQRSVGALFMGECHEWVLNNLMLANNTFGKGHVATVLIKMKGNC